MNYKKKFLKNYMKYNIITNVRIILIIVIMFEREIAI